MELRVVREKRMFHKAVLRDGMQLDVVSDKITPRVEESASAARVPISG